MIEILNIPRTHTAIAEWLFCLLFIVIYNKRFKGIKLYLSIIMFLGIFIFYQWVAGQLPIGFWILGMIGAVLLMFLFIFSMTDLNIKTIGYITLQAFIMAEFAASLEWQIYYYFISRYPNLAHTVLEYSILSVIFILLFVVFYVFEVRYKSKNTGLPISKNDLMTAAIISILVFAISNLSFVNIQTPITGSNTGEIFYIRTLVDLVGIVLFYSISEHKLAAYTKMELNALEGILNRQYTQYKQYQDSIDIINQKYHDLKHQIGIIRTEDNPFQKAKYLEELEKGMNIYDTHYKTGNNVLDTILTSKGLTIVNNNINFTCVADGSLIDFISVMDICSIFGNALDNSLESVKDIKEKDKRLVKMAVFKQKQLLLIKFENYYDKPLKYVDGMYLTTKKDKTIHGYGLKSIRSIVEKYNGTTTINTQNNWFTLLILIPIP